jgi:hypothetical protein
MGTENVPETWAFFNYPTSVITREDTVHQSFPLDQNTLHVQIFTYVYIDRN